MSVCVCDDALDVITTMQVPALDNGEMIWAMYACAFVLNQIGEHALADRLNKSQYLRSYTRIIDY